MARDLLDLHGCRVDEVADRLDRFLVTSQNRGLPRVRVMTGKGTGQVRQEVIAYLKLGHYPWQYEKTPKGDTNSGVLIVFLE